MTPVRRQRTKTARYIAEKMGISVRTVCNYVAEERSTYTDRAAARRRIAGEMRAAGASWDEIAAAVNGTPWAARSLVRRYAAEQRQETEQSHAA
jgi:transcriptional regulator with XRE-family HTH domain